MSHGTAQEKEANGARTARERKRTARLTESLPRGIQIGMRVDGRAKPYFVRWGKDRTLESFASEKDRNDMAEKLAKGMYDEGAAVLSFDAGEWRDYKRFLAETGLGLPQVKELVLAAKGRSAVGLLNNDAVTRYLPIREADGTGRDSFLHLRKNLGEWIAFRGDQLVNVTEADDVRAWLVWLKKRYDFEPVTLRNYRKSLRTFFEWVRTEIKARMDNPCDTVEPPPGGQPRRPLTVMEAYQLLRANRHYPIAPKLALEMFGALRCASVERIQREHVKYDLRGIEMPGYVQNEDGEQVLNHKSGKRKFRQGHPAVLWEWLALATEATWTEIHAKNYDEKKSEAFIRAGLENPGNALRHSFCSYHLAHFKNIPLTSRLMQHTNQATTEGYEGFATEQDARTFLTLTPCRVLMGLPEIERTATQFLRL